MSARPENTTSAPFPWLPLHLRRQRDPRLALAAKALRKRAPEVHGYIAFAMGACAESFQDGVFRAAESMAHTAADVFDAAAGWTGAKSLAEVLLAHGLLLPVEGGLMLDGWEQEQAAQCEKFQKERARAAARRSADREGTDHAPTADAPGTVRVPSADHPGTVQRQEKEGERQKEKETTDVPRATLPLVPVPPATTHSPAAATLLPLWRKACQAQGRDQAIAQDTPEVHATLKADAQRALAEAPATDWERVFDLVCGYGLLWTPSGRQSWRPPSLRWVLQRPAARPGQPAEPDVRHRAMTGTYGPWEKPAVQPEAPADGCDVPGCQGAPIPGEVWEHRFCQQHAREATEAPSPGAWVREHVAVPGSEQRGAA